MMRGYFQVKRRALSRHLISSGHGLRNHDTMCQREMIENSLGSKISICCNIEKERKRGEINKV